MTASYDIAGVLPEGTVSALPAGTSLLISGPAMMGKQELAIRLLAAGHEEGDGILCVTTSRNAASLLDEIETHIPTLDRGRVGIVDCSGSNGQRAIEEIATERVSTPGDLTGISISTAKLLQRFAEQDISAIRHGFVSISTLLQYLEIGTVFKFLHIYTSRIEDTQGIGVFTLDSSAHDAQTINTITGEFDAVIELRETDSGHREIRVKGFPDTDRSWRPFD